MAFPALPACLRLHQHKPIHKPHFMGTTPRLIQNHYCCKNTGMLKPADISLQKLNQALSQARYYACALDWAISKQTYIVHLSHAPWHHIKLISQYGQASSQCLHQQTAASDLSTTWLSFLTSFSPMEQLQQWDKMKRMHATAKRMSKLYMWKKTLNTSLLQDNRWTCKIRTITLYAYKSPTVSTIAFSMVR